MPSSQRPRQGDPRPRPVSRRIVEDDEPAVERPRGLWAWLRRPAPSGGPRIAVAYAVAMAASLLGAAPAAAIVSGLYERKAICPTDDFACPLVALFAAIALTTAAILLVGALLGRLGWLWWALTCALAMGVFQLVGADATNPAFLLVLIAPLAAALLSDPAAAGGRRWRIALAWVLTLAIVAEVAVQVWLALRA